MPLIPEVVLDQNQQQLVCSAFNNTITPRVMSDAVCKLTELVKQLEYILPKTEPSSVSVSCNETSTSVSVSGANNFNVDDYFRVCFLNIMMVL